MTPTVGILSMQRIMNYGSFLQAYALKKILESLGTNCYFIDIKPGRQLDGNKIDSPFSKEIKRVFRVGYNLVTNYRQTLLVNEFSKQLRSQFLNSYYEILDLNNHFEDQFDLVVIGSDEVFNCTQKASFGFSKQLFGQGLNAKSVISYAGSFGFTTIERIERFNLQNELSHCLNGFSDISVRDINSKEIIEAMTGKKPKIHLDPVLIYDFDREISGLNINLKDYIIIYTYINRITDSEEINAICSFAKKHNKKLISIFCAYTWCDQYVLPKTPFEVLLYFRNADYVVTDTFHGSIFSIITQRKFCVIMRDSNKKKLSWLLNVMGLESQLLNEKLQLEDIITLEPDYPFAQKVIEKERKRTEKYLKNYLQKT
nr:polysaccharide pyruvyl transferase family protein [uncultured Desulfobacter sp.]